MGLRGFPARLQCKDIGPAATPGLFNAKAESRVETGPRLPAYFLLDLPPLLAPDFSPFCEDSFPAPLFPSSDLPFDSFFLAAMSTAPNAQRGREKNAVASPFRMQRYGLSIVTRPCWTVPCLFTSVQQQNNSADLCSTF